MMEVEACRVLPGQMVQTISVDVGDAAAVEKAMGEAVAKQGAVQVQGRMGEATESVGRLVLTCRRVGSCYCNTTTAVEPHFSFGRICESPACFEAPCVQCIGRSAGSGLIDRTERERVVSSRRL